MLDQLTRSGDFVHLGNSDEYADYFKHISRVFAFLSAWYRKLVAGGNEEARIVEGFLEKLLYTVQMLRLKYLYAEDHKLALDLNDSGFPHWFGISELEAGLAIQLEHFKDLPGRKVVQEIMLEEMLRRGNDPVKLLPQMAEVQFADELDGSKLIFTFTPGALTVIQNGPEDGEILHCLFSWLCYDRTLNRPYIYIMAFDFAGTREDLRIEYEHGDFLTTVCRSGDREIPLAVLATDIDNALLRVSPKIVKRISLGPILCPKYSVPDDNAELIGWLSQFGEPDDFALLLESGILLSKGVFEEKSSWFFGNSKKVKQIFALSDDELAGEQQASEVSQMILLPHHVLQHISETPRFNEMFGRHKKVAYNLQGGLYVV
jgi:hypothetical protein